MWQELPVHLENALCCVLPIDLGERTGGFRGGIDTDLVHLHAIIMETWFATGR